MKPSIKSRIAQYLKDAGMPMTPSKIAYELGLTEVQVAGALYYMDNVEKHLTYGMPITWSYKRIVKKDREPKLLTHPTGAGWMFCHDVKLVALLDINLNLISDEFAEELGQAVTAAIKDAVKNPPKEQAYFRPKHVDVLTDRRKALLELIKRNPRIPYRQIAHELGINDSAVKKHLDKLKEAGLVERVGGTRGYWNVQE